MPRATLGDREHRNQCDQCAGPRRGRALARHTLCRAVGAGLGSLAILTVLLILFTLVPLHRWEARLGRNEEARGLTIYVRDDSQAVGKTLAALSKLGMQVRQATVAPGVGTSAVLRVQLAKALRPEQAALLEKRLLTLRSVERVDTRGLDLEDDEREDEGAVVHDVDVTEEGEGNAQRGWGESCSGDRNTGICGILVRQGTLQIAHSRPSRCPCLSAIRWSIGDVADVARGTPAIGDKARDAAPAPVLGTAGRRQRGDSGGSNVDAGPVRTGDG